MNSIQKYFFGLGWIRTHVKNNTGQYIIRQISFIPMSDLLKKNFFSFIELGIKNISKRTIRSFTTEVIILHTYARKHKNSPPKSLIKMFFYKWNKAPKKKITRP